MADIARYPFLRHLRGSTTTHVQHLHNGTVRHSGVGVGSHSRGSFGWQKRTSGNFDRTMW